MTELIIYFTLSIVVSFLCSVWEAVYLSMTTSFINTQIENKTPIAQTLKSFKEKPGRPISAILTLNTVAHTVGAIGVGAAAGEVFGKSYIPIPFINVDLSYEAIVATVMTLMVLILSEIIPKTLGKNYWRGLASFTVRSLKMIIILMYPLIWVTSKITKLLKKEAADGEFSKAEFLSMTNLGHIEGVLKESESNMIHNLLRLNKLKAKDIMTPRTMIVMAEESTTLEEFKKTLSSIPFSRIPVYESNRDNISGFVLKTEILTALLDGKNNAPLSSIKRPMVIVNDGTELQGLFEFLSKNRSHITAVSDEYGSVIGLVTLEDLFETIVGFEILDESDSIPDLQNYARKKWEERAKKMGLPITAEEV